MVAVIQLNEILNLQLDLAALRRLQPAGTEAPWPAPGAVASPPAGLPVQVSAPPLGGARVGNGGHVTSCCWADSGTRGRGEERTATQEWKLSTS